MKKLMLFLVGGIVGYALCNYSRISCTDAARWVHLSNDSVHLTDSMHECKSVLQSYEIGYKKGVMDLKNELLKSN